MREQPAVSACTISAPNDVRIQRCTHSTESASGGIGIGIGVGGNGVGICCADDAALRLK